jgi:hypothetical protein
MTGLWVPAAGVFLVTLYLSWSPWHYTGQNYGIAVMFLRRNGVEFSPVDKRWLYASFLLSYALVIVVMHSEGGNPGVPYSASTLRFQPIGIPMSFVSIAAPLLMAGGATTLLVAAIRLLRRAPPRALIQPALLLLTQVLWFTLPFLFRHLGTAPFGLEPLNWDFRTYYFLWIAAGHSIQYLWVTSYYARQSGHWPGYTSWYAKTLAAGSAVWMLPAILVGPLGLGVLSMDMGLALLIASAVNVHHFVLDGAIWKLRGRIAQVLIRNEPESDEPESATGWAGPRRLVWALSAFAVFLFAFHVIHQDDIRARERRNDIAGVRAAWDRLRWFGLDEAQGRLNVGRALLSQGELTDARKEFERTTALAPLPDAWVGLSDSYAKDGDWVRAAEACEQGLEVAPDHLPLLARGAFAWREAGEPARALALIERAVHLAPADAQLAQEYQRIVIADRKAR